MNQLDNDQNRENNSLPYIARKKHYDEEKQAKERLNSVSSNSDEMFRSLDQIMDDPAAVKREKRIIMKNLILICFAFLCNFTAFGGTSSLQSSLNYEEGLGTTSLAVVYGSLILSAMFTPTIVIKLFGCKWTIVICIFGYVTYPLANFYPHWGTLMPSSIIVGTCAAPLWSAKCSYLTTVAKRYARLSKESVDTVVNRFFGIFFLFFQFNNIIGQLISSFVLSSEDSNNLVFPSCFNETFIENYCGANDCQDDFNVTRRLYNSSECPMTDLQSGKPSSSLIYSLMGIYVGVALFGAVVVWLFVDPIQIRVKEKRGIFDLLIASFRHMKDSRQQLLILITMYSGFEQAFLTGDVTRSFITCPLAVNWVGFVLICFGVCDASFSYIFGKVEKHTGRLPLFSLAFVINLILIFTFLYWVPYPSAPYFFFLLPALWGVADAVWQTQLNALYGVLFISNQEASFANYRLWESLGFVIAFGYQKFICVSIKLYVLMVVLITGMIFYFYIEWKECKKKSEKDEINLKKKDFKQYFQSRKPKTSSNDEKFDILVTSQENESYLQSNTSVYKTKIKTNL